MGGLLPPSQWYLTLYNESCDSRRNPIRASSTRVPSFELDYPSTPAGFEMAFLRSRGAGGGCLLHTVEDETTTTPTSRSLRQRLWWAGLTKNKHEEPPSIGGPGSRRIIKAEAYSPNQPVLTTACVDHCGNLARLLGRIWNIGRGGQGLCFTELPWQHSWSRTWGTDGNLTGNAPVYMWYKQRDFKKSSRQNECERTWRDSCLFVSCLSHPFFHSVLLILLFKPLY